jgi:hypothetical protein
MTGLEILIEGLVAGLLVATIVYAAILNRKLNTLRGGKAEFEAQINDLNVAVERVGQGIAHFRKLSETNSARLNETVKDAHALRDDLGFLVERGAIVADRMVAGMKEHRSPGLAAFGSGERDGPADDGGVPGEPGELSPEAEENLRNLLKSMG